MEQFKEYILKSKNFSELYDVRWKLHIGEKIERKHYNKLKIGLINVPCGGYGDVIKCIKVFTYFKIWYPGINVQILSSSKQKFRNLGIKAPIIDIKHKTTGDDPECNKFKDLKLSNKKKFDLYLIVPVIADPFKINDFKKIIPYATKWNTYTMSEYNDIDTKPTDFPIGVGKGTLGLFFDKPVLEKQKLIKNPYALVYIQPRDDGLLHSRYCFLSFLEMIIQKDKYKDFKTFEIILPNWICQDILDYNPVKTKCLKILKQHYNVIEIITNDESNELYNDSKIIIKRIITKRISKRDSKRISKSINSKRISKRINTKRVNKSINKRVNKSIKKIILRGDILPQPREKFIGLIQGSVKDILLTGDESLVDSLNCCKEKTIWYQIAPWKQNLAESLYLETGNENYKTYKTSCGNLKGYKFKNDVNKLIKENDFRIKGKERFDSALIGFYNNKDKDIKKMIELIEHSRNLNTLKKKIKNM